MCIIWFDWLIALYLFISLVCNTSFLIVKNIGVREEDSDVKKSLCKNIFLVSSCLCTSSLVRAPPQLTLFTSPTTPSMPRHVRGRQFPTLEIWKSPNKFIGKHKTQINVYVYIYMRSMFQSARLGWRCPPLRMNSSVPKKTRIPVGQPLRIRSWDRPPRRLFRRQLRQPAPPCPNQNYPLFGGVEATSSYPPPPEQRGGPPPPHPHHCRAMIGGGVVTSASWWYRLMPGFETPCAGAVSAPTLPSWSWRPRLPRPSQTTQSKDRAYSFSGWSTWPV